MGTVVEIRISDPGANQYSDVVTAAFKEMERIENLMSPYVDGSDVQRLSDSGSPVAVSAETIEVLHVAARIATESGGAFNAGIGRLIQLWGFAGGQPVVPEREMIDRALAGVEPGSVTVADDGTVIKVSPHLAIDLGGIAKGYAIDRAVQILADAGIRHASVNAGGDMRLIGDRSGSPWRIGIQHPRQSGQLLARLDLAGRAVVTSGDYERSFESGGILYHHLLDPRTGYPARGCQAVTVVAENAAYADALATAVFVLGPEAGLELLRKSPAEGLIVAADGAVQVTDGLKEVVVWP